MQHSKASKRFELVAFKLDASASEGAFGNVCRHSWLSRLGRGVLLASSGRAQGCC